MVLCVGPGIDPEWSASLKIFFFVCLFLPWWFPYLETFNNFLNSYKSGILQLSYMVQMLKFVKIQIIFIFF